MLTNRAPGQLVSQTSDLSSGPNLRVLALRTVWGPQLSTGSASPAPSPTPPAWALFCSLFVK